MNDKLVRGLDYYTKTVFEWTTDQLGSQATVCGGGRYDGLVKELGGQDIPGQDAFIFSAIFSSFIIIQGLSNYYLAILENLKLFKELKGSKKFKIYALTNWSNETFPVALELFDFLNLFEGIVVSGREFTRKPFPKIYQILMDRYAVLPHQSVFIDDNLDNVIGAQEMGFHALQFINPEKLFKDLGELGIQF